jgi:hypothetical protein
MSLARPPWHAVPLCDDGGHRPHICERQDGFAVAFLVGEEFVCAAERVEGGHPLIVVQHRILLFLHLRVASDVEGRRDNPLAVLVAEVDPGNYGGGPDIAPYTRGLVAGKRVVAGALSLRLLSGLSVGELAEFCGLR